MMRRDRTFLRLTAAGLVAALAVTAGAAAAAGDPGLDQEIDPDQPIATDQAVLSDGHVDIGPRYVDDVWTLLVHDDRAEPATWRAMPDTVFQVGDIALTTVPDDPAYAFLPAEPGTDVHVVPQAQQPGVVWVGWNTQDPAVMESIDRGATLTLRGVEGPGDVVMFLQSGTLGEPEVLWDSREPYPQDIWVEVNTHTHANWVFSEPGVYLVEVEVSADLVSGETESDTQVLRFAVGDATSTDEAFAAAYAGAGSVDTTTPAAADDSAGSGGDDGGDDGGPPPVLPSVVGGAAALLVLAAIAALRGRRAKRRAAAGLTSSEGRP
jgi:putative ABC transporter-associated repeat protein